MAPRIGITLDSEEGGGYSPLPWYALRRNYVEAVSDAGGVPFCLPHDGRHLAAYLDGLDGLVISGGAFDLDPSLFGASERHASVTLKPGRTVFELALFRTALERDMPILGICGGEQLLAVALGGSLHQHIPDDVDSALTHEQTGDRHRPGHLVTAVAGTRLHALAGSDAFGVNSTHHQAVKDPGPRLVASAHAPDGVIEAVEAPERRFCLGVQWHPEYKVSPVDQALFRALVEACP